jgi:hypothetical protein
VTIIYLLLFQNKIVNKLATLSILKSQENFVDWRQVAATANMSFDEYCEEHGEWEAMERRAFVKRAGVFYFVDADFLRIIMVRQRHNHKNYSFTVDVRILKDNSQVAFIQNVTTKMSDIIGNQGYQGTFLDAQLNLTATGVKIDTSTPEKVKQFTVQVNVYDHVSRSRTKQHLTAKIKNLESDFFAKKSSLLCLRCYLIDRPNEPFDYASLKWWIEINKRAGYDHVELCDHGMSKDARFQQFFNKHRNFLILNRLDCLPNMEMRNELNEPKYITAPMLKYGDEFSSGSWDIFHHIFQNECYMQHIDVYRFVSILDVDEIILPKVTRPVFTHNDYIAHFASLSANRTYPAVKEAVTSDITCNRYDNQPVTKKWGGGGSVMDAYLLELINTSGSNISVPKALHFNNGYPIDDMLVMQLFDGLEKTVSEKKHSNKVNMSIQVTDRNRPTGPFSFEFTIQSDKALSYALGMLKVYRAVIQPYLRKNKDFIERCASIDFARIFVLNGPINNFQNGKTMSDTRITLDVSIHYPENHFERDRASNRPVVKYNKPWNRLLGFNTNLAHFSHFRKFQKFPYKHAPIESLYVDLNYMNCYFMPLLQELKKEGSC